MTFKDLKKRVSLEATTTQQQSKLAETLHNKPFWIWNVQEHRQEDIRTNGLCCFNHIIGLPQKDGNDEPLYDYERIIFDSLVAQNGNKHLWIKKATGLGFSEFMLRFIAWLCLKDNALSGSQMCIVTGPRIDLAIALIDRMKRLLAGKGLIIFDTKETVIELNGVKIEAFPSHHLDAMRGLPNVSFILLDEADFFPPGQQQDARDVSERYIAKSNPYIVMVSTPNAPEGLFERIEKEAEVSCLYKRIFLDYTYGVGKIYTAEEIEKAKQSPSFEREYNLKYLGKIGNVSVNYQIQRFRPRIEGLFARIERWTNTTTGEIHWRSISCDNVTTLYGKTKESRISDPSDISHTFSISTYKLPCDPHFLINVPLFVNFSMRSLSLSATYTFPEESTATPFG